MSERFIKEIEEILEKANVQPAKSRPTRQRGWFARLFSFRSGLFKGWGISPGRLMLAGVTVFLVGLLLWAVTDWKAQPVLWAGLGLFVLAYILFFVRPGASGGVEKRWRGRPVDDVGPPGPDKDKRWFRH